MKHTCRYKKTFCMLILLQKIFLQGGNNENK